MLTFVHEDHLKHLIGKYVQTPDSQAYLQRILNQGTAGRKLVADELEHLRPGLVARLENEWRDHGMSSVHLYLVPALAEQSPGDLLAEAAGTLKRQMLKNVRHKFEPPEGEAPGSYLRIVHLRDDGLLDVEVDVVRQKTINRGTRFERSVPDSQIVLLRMHLAHPDRLTEAYAGADISRAAMEGLLAGVFGYRRTPRAQPLFVPFTFNDAKVRMLAARLGLDHWRAEAMRDPTGVNGRVMVEGRLTESGRKLPIDLSADVAKKVIETTNNERIFLFSHTHDDGFVEEGGLVTFSLRNARCPGVQFFQRTSLSAKRRLLLDLVNG